MQERPRFRAWAALCLVLLLASIFALAEAAHLAHLAGCAGDLKSGTAGDPREALKLENRSAVWTLIGAACFASAVFTLPLRSTPMRFALALLSFILLALVSWDVAITVEGHAISSC